MAWAVGPCRVFAFLLIILLAVVTRPPAAVAQNYPFSSGVPELDELDMRMLDPYTAGRFSETIPLHKRAIAVAEKAFGRDDPRTIKRIEDCGHMLSITGQIEEAKTYYERALAGQKRVIASKKKASVDDFASLANLYMWTEQYDKSESVYKQVLDMREKLVGPSDASVART